MFLKMYAVEVPTDTMMNTSSQYHFFAPYFKYLPLCLQYLTSWNVRHRSLGGFLSYSSLLTLRSIRYHIDIIEDNSFLSSNLNMSIYRKESRICILPQVDWEKLRKCTYHLYQVLSTRFRTKDQPDLLDVPIS